MIAALARRAALACIALLSLSTVALAADGPVLDPRIDAAVQVYRTQGPEQALPLFEKLAGEFTRGSRTSATRNQRAALHYLGECHWRLGRLGTARGYLDRSLALSRAAGDRADEARTLNVLGLLAWDEGRYDDARAGFRRAGEIARALGDRRLEGSALNNLSLVLDELGDYDTSLQQYQRVLELYRQADFPRGLGDTLGNIGGVHLLLGRFREARDYYEQALAISERLQSKVSMSQDHGNLGLCLLGLGEVGPAMEHFRLAIELARQAGMRQDQAYWLRARGDGHVSSGRYDLALQDYSTALSMYEGMGAQAELLESLHAAGELHLMLGDTVSARRQFERALTMARGIGLDRGITSNLLALGDLEMRRGRVDAAVLLYQQARDRAEAAGAAHTLARALLRLARAQRSREVLDAAAAGADRALALARDAGSPSLQAEARYARAEVSRLRGHHRGALDEYTAAAALAAKVGDPDLMWQVLHGRARSLERSGELDGALATLEQAVELIESVRGRLREQRFRSGYVEDKFEVYLELMRLQLQLGRTADAFITAERLRARSFVDQVGGRASWPLTDDDRRQEAALRERVRRLQHTVGEIDDTGAPAYPERAIHRFSRELAQAEAEYQAFLDDRGGQSAGTGSVPGMGRLQSQLRPREALMEYVVARDRLTVFVLTSRGIQVTVIPVGEAQLNARIALLRDLLRHPRDNAWQKPAARLHDELVGPLERAGWLDGVEHLYVVPHGALTTLPFALLQRASAPRTLLLIDRYTIAYLPAAAALVHDVRPRSERTLLAMAPGQARLRFAAAEAQAVDTLFRPASKTLIGQEATEARFKQLAGEYGVLHLATHGRFNVASPLLSGLEFEPDREEDGMLRVHEVLDLRLQARLVTLSACETALASGYFTDLPAADGFVGLNRAFLAAGSEAVLATLWPVDDRASVTLMTQFYSRLRDPVTRHTTASALARAQRALRESPALAHPYYWAAYVVVGPMRDEEQGAAPRSPGRRS